MSKILPPRIFICYAKKDATQAEKIYEALKTIGVDPWLDSKVLVQGDWWENEIKQAVAKSDAFVVCLRPGFDEIGFRQKEIRWAMEALELRPLGQAFIIPFIVEPCEIPTWCKPLHLGANPSKPTIIEDLLVAVKKHCFEKSRTPAIWRKYTEQGYSFDQRDYPITEFELKVSNLISSGDRVLDIGTGPGRFVDLAFKRGSDIVVAIEPRAECQRRILESSEYAQKALRKGNFIFIQGKWPDVSEQLRHHKFDIVFSQSSLHYLNLEERHKAFSRIRWILKPKGIFALAVKSIDNAWFTVGDAEKIGMDRWRCKDGIQRTFFTIHGLLQELRGTGFNVKSKDCSSRIVEGYEWPDQLTVWHEIITIV